MYYLLMLLLIMVTVYVLTHVLSSLFKGCITTLGLLIIVGIVYIFVSSTFRPVNLLNYFVVENFEVRKVAK